MRSNGSSTVISFVMRSLVRSHTRTPSPSGIIGKIFQRFATICTMQDVSGLIGSVAVGFSAGPSLGGSFLRLGIGGVDIYRPHRMFAARFVNIVIPLDINTSLIPPRTSFGIVKVFIQTSDSTISASGGSLGFFQVVINTASMTTSGSPSTIQIFINTSLTTPGGSVFSSSSSILPALFSFGFSLGFSIQFFQSLIVGIGQCLGDIQRTGSFWMVFWFYVVLRHATRSPGTDDSCCRSWTFAGLVTKSPFS
mmetsp:Transcript_18360/g.45515  ORF Transcript_18360/g.45515 Transcript_18360/m.45515 type:complete len:251 (-) Transcript_18360:911-1663(-)